jgi:primosomal replication protein N
MFNEYDRAGVPANVMAKHFPAVEFAEQYIGKAVFREVRVKMPCIVVGKQDNAWRINIAPSREAVGALAFQVNFDARDFF